MKKKKPFTIPTYNPPATAKTIPTTRSSYYQIHDFNRDQYALRKQLEKHVIEDMNKGGQKSLPTKP